MTEKLQKKIFGDFQTPETLARQVTELLVSSGITPSNILEPTCGLGSFVKAAQNSFPNSSIFAYDINEDYLQQLEKSITKATGAKLIIEQANFFNMNWETVIKNLRGEILVVGNPPWITNSAIGSIGISNLPTKSNINGLKGFEAKTGKSNFDIAEWMLIKLLNSLHHRKACLAMLCKSATARKVLSFAWVNQLQINNCSIHQIDAKAHFNASVDACLLIIHTGEIQSDQIAAVFDDLSFKNKINSIGMFGKQLIADLEKYEKTRELFGYSHYRWRSGVKHDASKIMEFTRRDNTYFNGFGDEVDIENDYVYPLLKSSDIANDKLTPSRFVLITQKQVKDRTSKIKETAPRTWEYLQKNRTRLENRKSIIYRKRQEFAIFGIGNYSFAPWKVVVSGLYKNYHFQVIGTFEAKPIMLDDTCYFLSFDSQGAADEICNALNTTICKDFLEARVFLDSKRPITADLLNKIDIKKLLTYLENDFAIDTYLPKAEFEKKQQIMVFERPPKYKLNSSAGS
ncbi:MAG: SAM-dependent DNA methyltransferase [bacterium]|nr:SAM-dependent DNA methyltransferase [bacterium]